MNTKFLVGIVVAILVVCGLGYAAHSAGFLAGAAPNPTGQQHRQTESFLQGLTFGTRSQSYFENTGKFRLGASGTELTNFIATTCTGIVYASLSATTTQSFDCAVTGALTTAKFVGLGLATQPSLSASMQAGLVIWGGHASTTAGYVSGYITNLMGAATSSYAQATTSIPVLVVQ